MSSGDLLNLQSAAQSGDAETIRQILTTTPSLNINTLIGADFGSTTVLHSAVYNNQREIVQLLTTFPYGEHALPPINVNVIDGRGRSAFAISVELNYLDCGRVLYNAPQVDVHSCSEKFRGATHPLIVATRAQQRESVEFLINECGVDPRHRTPTGLTALAVASQTGNVPLVEYLLRCGIEPEEINGSMEDGTNALYWAVVKDNIVVAERLIESGADGILENKDPNLPRKSVIKEMMVKDITTKGRWLDLAVRLIDEDKTGTLLCELMTRIDYGISRKRAIDQQVRDIKFLMERGVNADTVPSKILDRVIKKAIDEKQEIHPRVYALFRPLVSTQSSYEADFHANRVMHTRSVANALASRMRDEHRLYRRLKDAMKDTLQTFQPVSDDLLLSIFYYQQGLSPKCDDEDDIKRILSDCAITCMSEDKDSVEWAWFSRFIRPSAIWYEEWDNDEEDDDDDDGDEEVVVEEEKRESLFDHILLKQCQQTLRTEELKLSEEVTIQLGDQVPVLRGIINKEVVTATITTPNRTPVGTPRMTPRFQPEEKTFSFGEDMDEPVTEEPVGDTSDTLSLTLSKAKFELENFRRQDELIFSSAPDARPIGFVAVKSALDLKYDVENMLIYDKNINLRELIALGEQINDEFQMFMEEDLFSEIIEEGNAVYRAAPVKTFERCQQKIAHEYKDEYYPQCARLLDIVRCSLVLPAVSDLERVIDSIHQSVDEFQQLVRTVNEKQARGEAVGQQVAIGLIDIARIKNGFSAVNPNHFGNLDELHPIPYADVTVNGVFLSHRVQKAMIIEIKLILKPFLETKKETSRLYTIFRDLHTHLEVRELLDVRENITDVMSDCIRKRDVKGLADLVSLRMPVDYYGLKEALKSVSRSNPKRETLKALVSECK